MIALRPSVDLIGGLSLVVIGLQQAVEPSVPAPFDNIVTALLTGSGVAASVVYFGRRWADHHFSGLTAERETERKERDRQHSANETRFTELTAQVKELSDGRNMLVSEIIAVHREDALFWRNQYLAERDRCTIPLQREP